MSALAGCVDTVVHDEPSAPRNDCIYRAQTSRAAAATGDPNPVGGSNGRGGVEKGEGAANPGVTRAAPSPWDSSAIFTHGPPRAFS